jgi:hypothetical protein
LHPRSGQRGALRVLAGSIPFAAACPVKPFPSRSHQF